MSGAELPLTSAGPGPLAGRRVDTNTWQMWAIALLPLLGLPLALIPGANKPTLDLDGHLAAAPVVAVNLVISLVLITAEVLLAVSDRRELIRRGVTRPMHPAWAILDIVYVIGRSVVVRRRVRGSLLPLWAWLAATVVTDVILNLPH